MDEADIASIREEAHRQDAMARRSLQKIATGNGTCQSCGDPVEAQRLAVLPYAAHCSACASVIEADQVRIRKYGR